MKLRVPPRRAVAVAAASVAVCYFAFWACAPTSTLPPPVPMADQPHGEYYAGLGSGLGWNSWPPEGESADLAALNVNAAFGYNLGDGVSSGLIAYGPGVYDLRWAEFWPSAGAGAYLRYLATPGQRFATGFNLQVGWLYASAGLPLSGRLGRRVWLWTQPSVVVEPDSLVQPSYRFPLGLSVVLREQRALTVQANLQKLGYMDGTLVSLELGFGGTTSAEHSMGGDWDRPKEDRD
jgi:hypothetical protein